MGWDPQHAFVGPPSHPESKGPGEVAALHVARDFAVSGMQDSEKKSGPASEAASLLYPSGHYFFFDLAFFFMTLVLAVEPLPNRKHGVG